MNPLRRIIVREESDCLVVRFIDSGITDQVQIHEIGRELRLALAALPDAGLVLNFVGIRQFSAQAVHMLVTVQRELSGGDRRMAICGLEDELRQAFRLCEVEEAFDFYDTKQEALTALAPALV